MSRCRCIIVHRERHEWDRIGWDEVGRDACRQAWHSIAGASINIIAYLYLPYLIHPNENSIVHMDLLISRSDSVRARKDNEIRKLEASE